MTAGPALMILGVMMVLTVPILAIMEGVQDDADLTSWLISKPIQFIIAVRGMIIGGAGMIIAGLAVHYLPN